MLSIGIEKYKLDILFSLLHNLPSFLDCNSCYGEKYNEEVGSDDQTVLQVEGHNF